MLQGFLKKKLTDIVSINPGNVTDLISLLPEINKTWTDKGIKPKVSDQELN